MRGQEVAGWRGSVIVWEFALLRWLLRSSASPHVVEPSNSQKWSLCACRTACRQGQHPHSCGAEVGTALAEHTGWLLLASAGGGYGEGSAPLRRDRAASRHVIRCSGLTAPGVCGQGLPEEEAGQRLFRQGVHPAPPPARAQGSIPGTCSPGHPCCFLWMPFWSGRQGGSWRAGSLVPSLDAQSLLGQLLTLNPGLRPMLEVTLGHSPPRLPRHRL